MVNMIKREALLGESSSEVFASRFGLMKCEKASEEGQETEQRLVRQWLIFLEFKPNMQITSKEKVTKIIKVMGTGETSIWGKIKYATTILFGK